MDMATALAELGVTEASLDVETRDRLDRYGYAPLPGVLSASQVTAIRTRLAELLAAEGDQAGIEVHQERVAPGLVRGRLIRLRQDAYTDLGAAAIAEVPDKPGARRQDTVVTEEIRKRTLTTAADAAGP
jgi:hypothetical protein